MPFPLATERRSPALIAALGAALVALNPLAVAAHDRWDADYGFVAVVLLQGAIFLVAARAVQRAPGGAAMVAIVVCVGAALRLSLLFEAPFHSTDVYRYVWDGRVQATGTNPYRYIPADEALVALRDDAIYAHINRADYAVTIYPPAAQMTFWLFSRLAETVWAMKLGCLVLEAGAMVLLVRLLARLGRPASQLLLYAWHPLPVWEIAGDGHVDAGMLAFLVFALGAWAARRRLLVGALLALSVMFKPLTVAALPAFWRRWDWRVPAAFVAVVVAAYVPYADLGTGVLGFLPQYLGEEGIGDGQGFLLLRLLALFIQPLPTLVTWVYLIVCGALLAGLAATFVANDRLDVVTTTEQAQVLILAFLLVLSPNYPWYFVVLVPLGCLSPWFPAHLLTLLSVILYVGPPLDADPWTVTVQSALYGSAMAALAVDLYNRRVVCRRTLSSEQSSPRDH
jgi:alpha-1,6-mannosyltransferase